MSVQYVPVESILYGFDYDGAVPITFLPEDDKLSIDPCSGHVLTSFEPKECTVDRLKYGKLCRISELSSYVSSQCSSTLSSSTIPSNSSSSVFSNVSSNMSLDKAKPLKRSCRTRRLNKKTRGGKVTFKDNDVARKRLNETSQSSSGIIGKAGNHLTGCHEKVLLSCSYPRTGSKRNKISQHDQHRTKHTRDIQVQALNVLLGTLGGLAGPLGGSIDEKCGQREDKTLQCNSQSTSNGIAASTLCSHPSTSITFSDASQLSSTESSEYVQFQDFTPSSEDGLSDTSSSELNLEFWRDDLDQFIAWSRTAVVPGLVRTFTREAVFAHSESPSGRTCATNGTSPNTSQYGEEKTIQRNGSSRPGGNDNSGKRKRGGKDNNAGKPNKQRVGANESYDTATERKLFACHFHKRDAAKFSGPGKYKSCSNGWPGINRLKQHMSTAHAILIYCKRCKSEFKSRDEQDAHEDREERCERRQDSDFDDKIVTDKQREALKKKQTNPPTSDHTHWYQMWRHLFGDRSAPQSPYQDSDPTLWSFYQHAQHHASATVQRYRTEHPGVEAPDEVLLECFQFMLSHLYDEYVPLLTLPQAVRSSESDLHTLPSNTPIVTNVVPIDNILQDSLVGNQTNVYQETGQTVTSTSIFDLALAEPFTQLATDSLDPTLDAGYVFLSHGSYDDW